VEEDPDDFGTQGKTSRVKKAVAEKGHKSEHPITMSEKIVHLLRM
jgi:hypothetical protein